MTNLENIKNYIKEEIEERGFQDNQIEIDFSGICEEKELKEACTEMNFKCEKGEGQGVWWIYK